MSNLILKSKPVKKPVFKTEKQKERYKRFHSAMIDKDLSQTDLAEILGVTQVFICHLLWGERKGRAREKKLCEILGINYEEEV